MIIVTGGAGFIGSAVIAKLNQSGIKDIIVVDSLRSGQKWQNLNGKYFSGYYHKDKFLELINADSIDWSVDAVIHLGACSTTTETDAEYMMQNNYCYSQILANWALEKDIRFIYASSAATYGNGSFGYKDDEALTAKLRPLNVYGFSKNAFDFWAHENKALAHMVGLKFFNVYGPNEYHKGEQASVAFKGYHEILKTGRIQLFKSANPKYQDGEFYRDFVYVKDCVEVISWFLNNKNKNGLFNLGSGKASSWNQLAKALFKAMKIETKIDYVPMPENLQSQYQYFTEADMNKLKTVGCSINMSSIDEGVEDYVSKHLSQPSRHW